MAALHVGIDSYVFRYYVDYVQTWDRSIHTRFETAHEYAADRLMRDGWQKWQTDMSKVAYAQIEKFLSEVKVQGLKHKERR